jgi:hypothetical protein
LKKVGKIKRAVGLMLLATVATGCSGWPPYESDARKNFAENRKSFEQLTAKIRESELWKVSASFGTTVQASPSSTDFSQQYIVEDDPEWSELLDSIGMFNVVRHEDGSVSFGSGSSPFHDFENRSGYAGYVHDVSGFDNSKICLSEHKEISCGSCIVELEDDWYIWYEWRPEVILPDMYQAYLNDEMPDDEYFAAQSDAFRRCQIEGYSLMGYDIEEMIDSQDE